MAERLWQTDSINQAAAKRQLCCERGNVTQSLTEFFVLVLFRMIMASIKSSWRWTFYPPPRCERTPHPPPNRNHRLYNLCCSKKFNLTGGRMKVEWKCVHWDSSASDQQHGLQSCSSSPWLLEWWLTTRWQRVGTWATAGEDGDGTSSVSAQPGVHPNLDHNKKSNTCSTHAAHTNTTQSLAEVLWCPHFFLITLYAFKCKFDTGNCAKQVHHNKKTTLSLKDCVCIQVL